MDENAGEGRQIRKGKLHVMWNGVWVDLGEAEFLEERGRVVKVLSFTPREFSVDTESEAPAKDGFLEEQRTDSDG